MPFAPVDQQPNFPALEHRVLERWRAERVFERSLENRADGQLFSFYEGPPTANGRPGVHHVEARVFKDIFPRYRTMKGYRVPRKAGWDCHGIPVEIEVEKVLGFTRKQDIEDYGVAAFNAKCRESVQRYVSDWNKLTERIAFWVDQDDAYWTMDTTYVESVWWSLKRLWDEGMIYEGHRVVPYCPRCGTALSDHEVAQGYATAVDPSVFVRFPVLEGDLSRNGASLLIWTTTPWTLISNSAVAIGQDISYVLASVPGDAYPVVIAADLVAKVLGDGAEVIRTVAVSELRGVHYRAPFEYVGPDGDVPTWRTVTVADFVTTSDGTGLVHMAPAFGEDDMRIGRELGLPVVNPVDLEGRFDSRVTDFAGQFVKAADPHIIDRLAEMGLLLSAGEYTHTYPFCWRCKTPLLYYAKPSWYIATTKVADRLMATNATTNWLPEHIRDGRYGDWLANNVDWSLSRERYWGTPLPLWRCESCDAVTCVGSRDELGALAGLDLSDLDPHRPHVDEIVISCRDCGGPARRVPEVIDAWYDSGSMPFAQFGYPHVDGSAELFEQRFPADFIAEAIDQTRGWFYSLHAIATLLFDRNSYRTVLVLGHIVDADGRKMSKSLGNILDPWELIESRGADALRWLLLAEGSPWGSRRVGTEPLDEVVRRFLLTLWNTYYFFTTYARIDGWTPASSSAPAVGDRPVMDRWVLAELAEVVRVVDESLDRFDTTTAGRALSRFVDDLSNWYVRRTRARFWKTSDDSSDRIERIDDDKQSAFATLHECLVTLSALTAPFTPFLADELYTNLVGAVDEGAPVSVHLLDFPTPDAEAEDAELRSAMATARRIVELGRRARQDAKIPVRQPLRRALITLPADDREGWPTVADVVAAELNIKSLDLSESTAGTVTYRLKANYRALGPVFGKSTPAVAAAIEGADADAVADALATSGQATLTVDGKPAIVTADHVQVIEEPSSGWQAASDGTVAVALNLTLDTELEREGIAREVVRAINELRKRRGLQLTDRIVVTAYAEGVVREAISQHASAIADEVLATRFEVLDQPADDGEVLDLGADRRVAVVIAVVQ